MATEFFNQEIFRWTIRYISSWIPLMPFLIGLYRIKTFSSPLRLIWIYCVLSLLVERIIFYLWQQGINNLPFFHIFTVIEFIIFSYYFRLEMPGMISKKRYGFLFFIFVGFSLVNIIFFQDLFTLNTYSRAFESTLLIGLSLISFYFLLRKTELKSTYDDPLFWVSSAVLIYFAGSFLIFLLGSFLSKRFFEISLVCWSFHSMINIIFYILLSISLWKQKKAPKFTSQFLQVR